MHARTHASLLTASFLLTAPYVHTYISSPVVPAPHRVATVCRVQVAGVVVRFRLGAAGCHWALGAFSCWSGGELCALAAKLPTIGLLSTPSPSRRQQPEPAGESERSAQASAWPARPGEVLRVQTPAVSAPGRGAVSHAYTLARPASTRRRSCTVAFLVQR